MEDYYLWLKAVHVIAIVAWMCGMLYLPRLFVYHAGVPVGSPQSETFKLMERRLLRAINTPAMIVVVGSPACGSPMRAAGTKRTGCTARSCSSS